MYDEWLTALKYLAVEGKPKAKFAIGLAIGVKQAMMGEVIDKLMDLGYIAFVDVDHYVITLDGTKKVESLL